jgi:hypothetical protein
MPNCLEQCHDNICSNKGLVNAATGKIKMAFAIIKLYIWQAVLHDITAGSKADPLHVSGASVVGNALADCYIGQLLQCSL